MTIDVSKSVGYAVLSYPEARPTVAKSVGFAVLAYPANAPVVSAYNSYAVMNSIPQVGDVLGVQGDTWLNEPTSYSYQWLRDGVAIAGATGERYTLVAADAGTMIAVDKTATNAGGSATVRAGAVGPIRAAG